jgi:ACS family hexuronate transporter-like MFS transporter
MPIAPPLEKTNRIGFRWVILALICVGTTINYINRLVIGILAPDLQALYHITDSQYGYITAAFSFAYAFGQLGCGKLLDRIGTRMGYGLALAGWSIAAMLTALGRGALSFGILRAILGVSEAPGYPAAAKVCAEWFPRRQRAFAFGFVNAGCNMAAIIAALIVPWLSIHYGWQAAFVVIGAMGLLLLAVWVPLYHSPQLHPMLGPTELALIESDPPESTRQLSWAQVLSYRQSWVFVVGKFLTDAMWWFFMSFIPKILNGAPFHLGLNRVGLPLVAIYFMADLGSVGGGWMSSAMIHQGSSVNRARKVTMLVMAMLVLPMMGLPYVSTPLAAILILGLATAGHQGFSSNNYTLCSDLFPKSMVGVISGLGGFFGYIGASIFTAFTGNWVQSHGNYIAPCFIASSAYLVSILAIHLVSPRLTPVRIVDAAE